MQTECVSMKNICSQDEYTVSRKWMQQDLQGEYPNANGNDLDRHIDDPEWVKKRTQTLQRELEKTERQAHGRLSELEVRDNRSLCSARGHEKHVANLTPYSS